MTFTIDETTLNTLLAAISAIILAFIAWMNKQRTASAAETAAATKQIATAPVQVPQAAPAPVPAPAIVTPAQPQYRYLMTDSVKQWLTFDATPENKLIILAQIDRAESQKLYHYHIVFDGGEYEIEGGNLKGSSGNPHDTTAVLNEAWAIVTAQKAAAKAAADAAAAKAAAEAAAAVPAPLPPCH